MQRSLLLGTAAGLTDEQAARRSTVSELCIGGIIKHVAATEAAWARFIRTGDLTGNDAEWAALDWSALEPAVLEHWAEEFRFGPDDRLDDVVATYRDVAAATDELVATLPDLDAAHPLPPMPWFEPGATRTARRVLVHIVAETAQHAGHADIIREAIDGQKSMG